MGIQDRDYWCDRYNKNDHTYNPKQFRRVPGHEGPPPPSMGMVGKTIILCLAVFGAVNLFKFAYQNAQQHKLNQPVIHYEPPVFHQVLPAPKQTKSPGA